MTNDNNQLNTPLPEQVIRMFYEACEQLGWSVTLTSEDLARRMNALERGLPAEDEFIALLSWLGKCKLVHKLDQEQHPQYSKELYQVPDLYAVFEYQGYDVPVLIEIKTTEKDAFKWSEKYFDKLQRYANQLNLPLLIAWKYRLVNTVFSLWTLFDSTAFTKPHTSYKINFGTASSESLLSQLAGDFMLDVKAGVGLDWQINLIGDEKDWQRMHKGGSFFGQVKINWTNGEGKIIEIEEYEKLPPGVKAILNCVPSVAGFSGVNADSHIVQSFRLKDNYPLFAQHVLLFSLSDMFGSETNDFRWRNILQQQKLPVAANEIRESASIGFEMGILEHMIYQVPKTNPVFLKHFSKNDMD